MSNYVKLMAAFLGAVGTWGYTASATNGISLQEYFGLLGVLATSLAVYSLPNTPKTPTNQDPGGV